MIFKCPDCGIEHEGICCNDPKDKRLLEGDSLVDLRQISDLKQAALKERIHFKTLQK